VTKRQDAGRRGGESTVERLGVDHMRAIGTAGGARLKATRDAAYYARISKLGAAKRWGPKGCGS
jgi:hypothetical protein